MDKDSCLPPKSNMTHINIPQKAFLTLISKFYLRNRIERDYLLYKMKHFGQLYSILLFIFLINIINLAPNLIRGKMLSLFSDTRIEDYSNSFVPYLYLDGHRSSGIGANDSERYRSGFRFFLRFSNTLQQHGFKSLVTMMHTSRNWSVNGRIESLISAIQNEVAVTNGIFDKYNFNFYGDIDFYRHKGLNSFFDLITQIESNKISQPEFTHHILINYSENWALKNLDILKKLPEINCVIRFTKGYVSGGWIPIKMQESIFVYSQLPSVSEYWSDSALKTLLHICVKNWSLMKQYMGKKEYALDEKTAIHLERDVKLSLSNTKIKIDGTMPDRIIAFGLCGPMIYELE